jgi:hypothetical protein
LTHQKNLIFKNTVFPHLKIKKCSWISPEGKTHNQNDHVLIDKRQQLNIVDVQSFREADCDTAKVRLSVSKQAAQNFDVERFNLEH